MVSIQHIFGTTLSLSRMTEHHSFWRSRTDFSKYSLGNIAFWWERKLFILWECVKRCKAFQYERVSKPFMTNSLSGYNYLFFSWFSEKYSPFSQGDLNLEEFIVGVIIQSLLPLCLKEFINLGFQVSIWNPEFVEGQFGCRVCSFISSHSNVTWDPAYKYFFIVCLWVYWTV